MIEIRLLGQFDLRLDGKSVEIPSRPAQSLLAYLALTTGITHRRERLAGLIWPDIPEADARRNLRRALWHIRKAAEGQAPLQADDITVAFDARPDVWVDALVVSQKFSAEKTLEELIQIVSAYGGELLPGFYDEWVIVERERLQAVFEGRINLLLDRLVEAHSWDEVIEWGERWIALGGAAEPAYQALMIAYSGRGDLSGVGQTYRRCAEALSRDLGVELGVPTGVAGIVAGQDAAAAGDQALDGPFAGGGGIVLARPPAHRERTGRSRALVVDADAHRHRFALDRRSRVQPKLRHVQIGRFGRCGWWRRRWRRSRAGAWSRHGCRGRAGA